MLHVEKVKYLKDYQLWLSFDDGTQGVINLATHLKGKMFTPLKNIDIFSAVTIDHELKTTTWPNGADFAPEFLKNHLEKSF